MHVFLLTSLVLGMVGCDSEALEDGAGDVATTQTPTAPPPPANVEVPMPELPEGHTVAVSVGLSKIQFTGAKFTGSMMAALGSSTVRSWSATTESGYPLSTSMMMA